MHWGLFHPHKTFRQRVKVWRKAVPTRLRRTAKHLGQLRYGWRHERTLTFVFGCQRSGTKMLMRVLDQSPRTRIYHENHPSAFEFYVMRPFPVIEWLAKMNPAPSVLLKPICDSQRADEIMEHFAEARGLWVYRHYFDVANSAVQKWGDHQLRVIQAIVSGHLEGWAWRTEGLSDGVIERIKAVARPELTPYEAGLLFWYLRNDFFFRLGLQNHDRMMLVKYEDLVLHPQTAFARVFEQIGSPLEPRFIDQVAATSVGKRAPPAVSEDIRALCDELLERLDAARATAPQ